MRKGAVRITWGLMALVTAVGLSSVASSAADDTGTVTGAAPGDISADGAAVGEVVEVAVTAPAGTGGRVDVEVRVAVDPGAGFQPGQVEVLIEREPGRFGHAAFDRATGVARASGVRTAEAAVHRAHLTFHTRADYVITTRLVTRGRPIAGAESVEAFRISSRFDQIGLIPLNTEIVDVTSDGTRLVSTGGGYVDVSDPRNPVQLPEIADVGTASVAITGDDAYALYVGNGSSLDVVDIGVIPAVVVRSIELPGEADAVATSADGRYAAAAFGPEDGDGGIAVIDTSASDPAAWTVSPVPFDGSDPVFAGGTAAEYVTFGPSPDNLIAGAFQGANTVAIVDPAALSVVNAFSLGTLPDPFTGEEVTLDPDGIGFAPDGNLLTANEGLTRSFAAFSTGGELLFDSGIDLLDRMARFGLDTTDPQFEEVDGVVFPDGETFIFAGMERTMAFAIYEASDSATPRFSSFARLDPRDRTDGRPEGIAVALDAGLVFVANEDDDSVSILERTTDTTGGVPAPRLGIQPISPAIPWTVLQELEKLPDGTFLGAASGYGNGRQLGGLYRVRFDGRRATIVDRLPLDVPAADLAESGAVGGATRDPDTGGYWVALNRPTPRVVLVGLDGTIGRTIALGEDLRNVTGLVTDARGRVLWVATENGALATIDLTTGAIKAGRVNVALQSLFRLADGGIATTYGDGRVGLQVRRVVSGPNGGFAFALIADDPGGLFNGQRRFAANDVLPAVGGDAVVLWSNDGGEDGFTTRLVHVDGLLVAATPKAPARVSLAMPGALVTVTAGGEATVEVTSDRAGGSIVETRPTRGRRTWTAVPGAIADGVPAGTVATPFTAPVLDGTYDVRVRFVTGGGATTVTAPVVGALVVDTAPPTQVSLSRPTTTNPVFAAAGNGFRSDIQLDRAGTFELLAKPAGSPDSDYAALPVPAGNQVFGSAEVRPLAPAAEPDPGTTLSYDLRLVFRAGGDGDPVVNDQPAALVVVPSSPATIALTFPEPGTTFQAGDQLSVRFTTDQPGTYEFNLLAPDGRPVRLIDRREVELPGEHSVFIDGFDADGGWGVSIRFTNLAGAVTDQLFDDAIVIATPPAAVNIVSPTTDAPISLPLFDGRFVPVRFTKAGPGHIEVGVRPTGSSGEFVVLNDGNYFGSDPDFVFESGFGASTLAPGTYDLLVAFTNALGERAEDIEVAVIEGLDDLPTFNVMEPTAANPVRSLPGARVPTWATTNFSYFLQQMRVQVRPSGSGGDWVSAGLQNFPQNSDSASFTAPAEPGTYDVRYALSIPQQSTGGPFVFFEEPAALVVAADGPGVRSRNANTFHPFRLAAGAQPELRFQGIRDGDYLAQYRPTGSDDGAWVDIAPFSVSADEIVGVVFSVPADLAAGSYDVRVVDTATPPTTGVEYQPAAIIVGPTPQAPVVVNELHRDFIELRNVTDAAIDVGGWGLTQCFAGVDDQVAAIPDGTVLEPGEVLVAGSSFNYSRLFPAARPADVNFDRNPSNSVAVHDASGQLVDSVSYDTNDTNRCRELAPSPQFSNSESITRDAAGTDTGDNSMDFTVPPVPTPGETGAGTP